MSDQFNRTEFENMMDEYLRGELSESKSKTFEEYVEQNPKAKQELEHVRELFEMTGWVEMENPLKNGRG